MQKKKKKNSLKKIVYLINLLLKHSCQKIETLRQGSFHGDEIETLKSRANAVVHWPTALFNTTCLVNGCFIAHSLKKGEMNAASR